MKDNIIRGSWKEVSVCKECDAIFDKEWEWMSAFFKPVCPSCGTHNRDLMGYSKLFEPRVARKVCRDKWWYVVPVFVEWEFKNE